MDLEQKAIERIKTASEMSLHHYGQPLICTYSGGKDSDVMLELFLRSGVPFEVVNSHTTADAPPTVYHIRDTFRRLEERGIRCEVIMPTYKGIRTTMWDLIAQKKSPPTRFRRYCCSVLKESNCKNRMIATGIRWAESVKRRERQVYEALAQRKKDAIRVEETMLLTDNDKSRKLFERCALKAQTVVNPIIDWADRDIWDFYWSECKQHNPLYGMGCYRVGCVGCPMAGKLRWKEFADFPTYQRAYIRAFDKMLEAIGPTKRPRSWTSGEAVFRWWMEDDNLDGQLSIYDLEGYQNDENR